MKTGKLFTSSTIYETFSSFNIVLCFCGFWYNGITTKNKHNPSLESIKILLSILYSLCFLALFVMNVLSGEQEPESQTSILLRHGSHKMYLIELLFLPIIIWSNFYHHIRICDCLQLIDRYDRICQVKW